LKTFEPPLILKYVQELLVILGKSVNMLELRKKNKKKVIKKKKKTKKKKNKQKKIDSA